MKKLKKQSNLAIFSEKQSVYKNLNVMQRHDMVNGLAKDVIAKIGKEAITKQRETELIQTCLDEGVNNAFCAALGVIWNNYGALRNKDTRLAVFEKLFLEALEKVSTPDADQLNAEAKYTSQTGHPISREVIKG